jgi:hypothetical protein
MKTLEFIRYFLALVGVGIIFYGSMLALAVGVCILFGKKKVSENV